VYDKTVRRRRAVLALLVAGSLVLLTASFGGGGALGGVQLGVVSVVAPVQEGASRALKPVRDLVGWVGDTFDAKGQLADLRTQRDTYRRQAVAGTAAVRENARLSSLLRLDQSLDLQAAGPVTARVIGKDPSVWWSTVTVNKGSGDGVRVDQPAVTGEGLVGRVTFTTGSTAVVTLVTDHSTYVPARINEPPGVDGGVAAETGRPDDLLMNYTRRQDRVDPGQTVVTSGTRSRSDRFRSLYPPNIPIGRVTSVENPGTDDQRVHVRPFADLHRLEFVQVLTQAPNGNRPAP
jgi:rod shape-determining protein MreC